MQLVVSLRSGSISCPLSRTSHCPRSSAKNTRNKTQQALICPYKLQLTGKTCCSRKHEQHLKLKLQLVVSLRSGSIS
jgi:hypothetical protein